MNKTEIKLGIVRTIKTAEFESLHITTEITEVVEWDTEKERDVGMDIVQDHLMSDFTKGYTSITKSIGVQRSLAVGELNNKMTGSTSKANVVEDDEIDMFGG